MSVEDNVAWMSFFTRSTWIQLERLKARAKEAGVNLEAIAEEVARTMNLPREARRETQPAPQVRPSPPAKKTAAPKARKGRSIFDVFSDEPTAPALPQPQARSLIKREKGEMIRRPSFFEFLGGKPPETTIFQKARKYKPL